MQVHREVKEYLRYLAFVFVHVATRFCIALTGVRPLLSLYVLNHFNFVSGYSYVSLLVLLWTNFQRSVVMMGSIVAVLFDLIYHLFNSSHCLAPLSSAPYPLGVTIEDILTIVTVLQ